MLIMGVVNITPDSFSDGGSYFEPDTAINRSLHLLREGADVVDIGAESTRPGSTPVSPTDEWQRLEPVLKKLTAQGLGDRISVDTRNDETMLKAFKLGVRWFNNIAGLCQNITLQELSRDQTTRYIAMHMHGEPYSMQQEPLDGMGAISGVEKAFASYTEGLLAAGFSSKRIFMDPGIGFGKTDRANLMLLARISELASNYQLLVGVSRKSFIGRLLDLPNTNDRDPPSKMLEFSAWNQGASIVRTHAVEPLAKIRETMRGEC
jgi:dihydropteroate synthase